jgi:mRNA interferase RelE/StbE
MSQSLKTYRIKLKPSVKKWLDKAEAPVRRRLLRAIEKLERPQELKGVKSLRGSHSYRIRVGDFRVIYEVYNEELLVLVIQVDHRRQIYRG